MNADPRGARLVGCAKSGWTSRMASLVVSGEWQSLVVMVVPVVSHQGTHDTAKRQTKRWASPRAQMPISIFSPLFFEHETLKERDCKHSEDMEKGKEEKDNEGSREVASRVPQRAAAEEKGARTRSCSGAPQAPSRGMIGGNSGMDFLQQT